VRLFAVVLTAITFVAAAPTQQTFTGRITDNMCARADHHGMQMGDTDAECSIACVRSHGALYVLWDGKRSYELSDQELPETFAGKKVSVTGTFDAKTGKLLMSSIKVAK
jgi:hypothetical protein